MSIWEKIKSLFTKKNLMLEEGKGENINYNVGRKEFVDSIQKLEYSPEQLKEQAKVRQFAIARDMIDKGKKLERISIPMELKIEKGLKEYGYGDEEITLDELELAILDRIDMIQKDEELWEYFSRDKMQDLVEGIKDMAIEEAGKFGYTKEAAQRFIPFIPDAMKKIQQKEIEELEAEQEIEK